MAAKFICKRGARFRKLANGKLKLAGRCSGYNVITGRRKRGR